VAAAAAYLSRFGRGTEGQTALLGAGLKAANGPSLPAYGLHEEIRMPAYITLASFTEQGARNIKESPQRYEAFKSAAEAAGVTIKSVHWTTGAYDIVIVSEGPEDAVMTLAMKTAALGNVRTQTLRGFSITEMRKLAATVK
jgi:uncharacterized protein with GYD domain